MFGGALADVVERHDLIAACNVNPDALSAFLLRVEAKYGSSPYHNSIHGADVMLHMHLLLDQYGLTKRLSKQQLFAAFIGALIHDFNHPGTTNSHEIKSGSLLALMGPSGSGKTSLLNALAFRVPKGPGASVSGTIYANGEEVATPTKMSRISANVEQEDALFALSTVRETLTFAAKLRLPSDATAEEVEDAVSTVIADLGLVAAADTVVGNEMIRGISGGERKRVAIGMDLLHDPKLIFMDEPTSGLDAFQALNVMTTLKDLAVRKGRTVVASVHQPRS